MTTMLHNLAGGDGFQERVGKAELAWVCQSEAAAKSLAENYVGLPFE